eukprot:TRINITY_DN7460_c1_g1_i2.p1 TRINITY_DN7460_c1_g1~~TRINITY_DN7460_c1_g1_i2.p1  ORF type:complete len:303 (+),score=90.27 TRINITY_DN7460_c1_g1_i2:378-1286(+)
MNDALCAVDGEESEGDLSVQLDSQGRAAAGLHGPDDTPHLHSQLQSMEEQYQLLQQAQSLLEQRVTDQDRLLAEAHSREERLRQQLCEASGKAAGLEERALRAEERLALFERELMAETAKRQHAEQECAAVKAAVHWDMKGGPDIDGDRLIQQLVAAQVQAAELRVQVERSVMRLDESRAAEEARFKEVLLMTERAAQAEKLAQDLQAELSGSQPQSHVQAAAGWFTNGVRKGQRKLGRLMQETRKPPPAADRVPRDDSGLQINPQKSFEELHEALAPSLRRPADERSTDGDALAAPGNVDG